MAAVVDARDLYAVYPSPAGGVAALRGLTLSVDEREICVVLGPSGSGKTTLMRVLAGLHRPSAGTVVVAGLDLGRASPRAAPALTAATFSAMPTSTTGGARRRADGRGARVRSARARVGRAARATGAGTELLERVGLLDRAKAAPASSPAASSSASRSARHSRIVRACSSPTSRRASSTPRIAEEVHVLLRELVLEQESAAVIVSHDPASTEIADRVVNIRDGRVSEEQPVGPRPSSSVPEAGCACPRTCCAPRGSRSGRFRLERRRRRAPSRLGRRR